MNTDSLPFTPPHRLGRAAYAALGLTLLVAVLYAAFGRGVGGWQALAFAVMPDIALFLGAGAGLAKGQLHPRAVPLYNALHVFVGPLLLAAAALLWLGPAWLVGALAWAAHVAIDRAVGYGPRTREGFQRG